jgi:hypothetical protein
LTSAAGPVAVALTSIGCGMFCAQLTTTLVSSKLLTKIGIRFIMSTPFYPVLPVIRVFDSIRFLQLKPLNDPRLAWLTRQTLRPDEAPPSESHFRKIPKI